MHFQVPQLVSVEDFHGSDAELKMANQAYLAAIRNAIEHAEPEPEEWNPSEAKNTALSHASDGYILLSWHIPCLMALLWHGQPTVPLAPNLETYRWSNR